MQKATHEHVSRRERQIMDALYASGRASAAEVMESMPDPPSYSAVRAMLRLLEEKGLVRHEQEGQRYIYVPTVPAERARRSALTRIVQTFFGGSAEQAVAALLDMERSNLDDQQLDRLAKLIEQAREEER
jgi:BlaI family transcriptional regulator, penicillinase repressor